MKYFLSRLECIQKHMELMEYKKKIGLTGDYAWDLKHLKMLLNSDWSTKKGE